MCQTIEQLENVNAKKNCVRTLDFYNRYSYTLVLATS
jgi:hypothetical protein